MASTALHRLETIGFRVCGQWQLQEDGKPKISLAALARETNVLYAFVCDGDVVYIGKTTKSLRARLYGYQNPGPTQTTNKRGNVTIREALEAKKLVEVVALADHGLLKYGGFHMNLAAGLEDDMLKQLKPAWNKRLGSDA